MAGGILSCPCIAEGNWPCTEPRHLAFIPQTIQPVDSAPWLWLATNSKSALWFISLQREAVEVLTNPDCRSQDQCLRREGKLQKLSISGRNKRLNQQCQLNEKSTALENYTVSESDFSLEDWSCAISQIAWECLISHHSEKGLIV